MDEAIRNLNLRGDVEYRVIGSSIFTYFELGRLVFERRYRHGELWSVSDNNGKVYMHTI